MNAVGILKIVYNLNISPYAKTRYWEGDYQNWLALSINDVWAAAPAGGRQLNITNKVIPFSHT